MIAALRLLAATLAEWQAGRGAVGGRVARGLGAFDLTDVQFIERDLDKPDALMALLRDGPTMGRQRWQEPTGLPSKYRPSLPFPAWEGHANDPCGALLGAGRIHLGSYRPVPDARPDPGWPQRVRPCAGVGGLCPGCKTRAARFQPARGAAQPGRTHRPHPGDAATPGRQTASKPMAAERQISGAAVRPATR